METIPRSLPILLDGATGTELYRRGMPQGVSAETWVLEHTDATGRLWPGTAWRDRWRTTTAA